MVLYYRSFQARQTIQQTVVGWDGMGQSLPERKRGVTYLRSGIIKTTLVLQPFNFGVGHL